MQLEVGSVVEGTVTGITKFGAFVSLPDGQSGLVHISEVADAYVTDVSEYVSQGSVVKVKIIGISDVGKINLSIKKAVPQEEKKVSSLHAPRPRPLHARPSNAVRELTFEDKLKQFMQDSDNKISGNRLYSDRRSGSRRRRG